MTTDHEHFGRIARLLSPPRRAVLAALAADGPMTPGEIAASWQKRDPDLSSLVVNHIDRAVSQSLWKLENLGMVRTDDNVVTITSQGLEALRAQQG